jgi:hypothetical protein
VIYTTTWGIVPGLLSAYSPKANNDYCIFENPFYAILGIDTITLGNASLYCSDDMESWTLVASLLSSSNNDLDVSTYRNKRYWKLVNPSDSSSDSVYCSNFRSNDLTTPLNIHFTTAPADDAVITADYTTEEFVKNTDYVLDVAVDIELGAYISN